MFFFFNDTATTEIYTLSLHDALPICSRWGACGPGGSGRRCSSWACTSACGPPSGRSRTSQRGRPDAGWRSEEHTSELQSRQYLVCRLLLEKKNKKKTFGTNHTTVCRT